MQEAGMQAYEVEDWKRFIKEIEERQEWPENDEGQEIDFDIDSSPKAWDHYRQYYFLDEGGLSKCFRDRDSYYDFECLRFGTREEGCGYVDSPEPEDSEKKSRLLALKRPSDEKENPELAKFMETEPPLSRKSYPFAWRLGGECDFNFSDERKRVWNKETKKWELVSKKDRFEAILNKAEDITEEEKKAAKGMLEYCSQMHHTPANLSLMFVPGKMQIFKGKGIFKEEKEDFEYLDRLDTLVFYLDEYFNRESWTVLSEASGCNETELMYYLEGFRNIYDYCRQVYFICDVDFVDRLIANGGKPIETGKDVIEYMDLANGFWLRKIGYFCSRLRAWAKEGGAE